MTNEEAEKILFYHRSTGNLSPMLNEALDLAISALSKQCSSSEQAKDVPDIRVGKTDFKPETVTNCHGLMDDLISRQAAIDALHMHLMYRMGTDSNKKRLDEWINNLPSAQPEQHTCVNCGRTVNNGGWYADGRTRCPIEEHYALPKDGYCHLWEERNVTDDNYPERREE